MRKLLLILSVLFCFAASAQRIQYVNTYGYEYQRLVVDTLFGLPKDTFAVPALLQNVPFIANKSGSIYNWNIVTHVWDLFSSGGGSFTASQGISLSGNDFQLGYPVGSELPFTNKRVIEIGDQSLHLSKHYSGTGFSSEQNAPIYARFVDSMTANGMSQATLPKFGTTWERVLRITGPYGSDFKVGHRQSLNYEFGDSARILTAGGDFGGAKQDVLYLQYLPSKTTGRTGIGGMPNAYDAAFATLSMVELPSSTSSRHLYVNGYIGAHTSYLRMINQPDTIENFIFYKTSGFVEASAKILNTYGLYINGKGDGTHGPRGVNNSWSVFSPENYYKMYHSGVIAVGDSTIEASALIDASSTTKGVIWPRMTTTQKNAITSPATGLIVFDTDLNQYNFYNGSAWASMGGGGSGTVNSGTQYRLGYYATTGTAISEAPAITASRVLVSDANGVPTHGTPTTTEINRVAGVTSDIQTQIDSKLSSTTVNPSLNGTSGSGLGVIPTSMYSILTSDNPLSDVNTAQNVFPSAGDVWTLQASTTYEFEGIYYITSGATSHSVGLGFAVGGGASFTNIAYTAISFHANSLSSTTQNMVQVTSGNNVLVVSASAADNSIVNFKGIMRINAGGTVTPQITFSAATGATPNLKTNSYIKFTPIGTNTFTTIGSVN